MHVHAELCVNLNNLLINQYDISSSYMVFIGSTMLYDISKL